MRKYLPYLLSVFLCLCSCSDDPFEDRRDAEDVIEKTVAVVLPMEDGLDVHWRNVTELFSSNLRQAFSGMDKEVRLNFEFFDESTQDMAVLSKSLAMRSDIHAVIGGHHSANARVLASNLCRNGVTLFTTATTAELVRAYSATGNLWAMTETDITQCEVLLDKVRDHGGKSVSLIANGDDDYGKTFIDWFSFQAKEAGLEVKGVFPYGSIGNAIVAAAQSVADFVVCVPSDVSELEHMVDGFRACESSSRLLFSDVGFGADVLSVLGEKAEGIEGVCYGADPEVDFDVSYRNLFGAVPTLGASQIYDACMLAAYAAWYRHLHPEHKMQEALRKIVDGREPVEGSWTGRDMQKVIKALADGGSPDVRGTSGRLEFDSKVYTNVLATTYYEYLVYEGDYTIVDHNYADSGNRTDATLAGWNRKAEQMQDFTDISDIQYGERNGNWAVLVATSSGWRNYRHQADVCALYSLLKGFGWSDENIIVIAEDDIAENQYNPNPGVISVSIDGENLYAGMDVDYCLSDLTPQDFCTILMGKQSDRLTEVVNSGDDDNIFIFWSGHGMPGALSWRESGRMTAELLNDVFGNMAAEGRYRKLAMFVETCYSGSVLEKCAGHNGMIFFTAADPSETSKADVFNADYGVWMTNRFTSTFIDAVAHNSSISLHSLYTLLFRDTVGSHVMVYNADHYGNLYRNSINEFVSPINQEYSY